MSIRTSEYLANLYSPDPLVVAVTLRELQDGAMDSPTKEEAVTYLQDAERMALSPDMGSVSVKMSDGLTVSAEAIEPLLHLLASTYETRTLSEGDLKMLEAWVYSSNPDTASSLAILLQGRPAEKEILREWLVEEKDINKRDEFIAAYSKTCLLSSPDSNETFIKYLSNQISIDAERYDSTYLVEVLAFTADALIESEDPNVFRLLTDAIAKNIQYIPSYYSMASLISSVIRNTNFNSETNSELVLRLAHEVEKASSSHLSRSVDIAKSLTSSFILAGKEPSKELWVFIKENTVFRNFHKLLEAELFPPASLFKELCEEGFFTYPESSFTRIALEDIISDVFSSFPYKDEDLEAYAVSVVRQKLESKAVNTSRFTKVIDRIAHRNNMAGLPKHYIFELFRMENSELVLC